MIQLAIEEPKIEQFFNYSKDEVIKALRFLVDNNIKDFTDDKQSLELTQEQKKELNERIVSFHNDRSLGRTWDEVKNDLVR